MQHKMCSKLVSIIFAIQKQSRRHRCARNNRRIRAINKIFGSLCVGVTHNDNPPWGNSPATTNIYILLIRRLCLGRPSSLEGIKADWHSCTLNPLHLSHEVPPPTLPPTRNPTHLHPSYKYCLIIQHCILPLSPRPPPPSTPSSPSQPHVRHGGREDCSDVLLARSSDVS